MSCLSILSPPSLDSYCPTGETLNEHKFLISITAFTTPSQPQIEELSSWLLSCTDF